MLSTPFRLLILGWGILLLAPSWLQAQSPNPCLVLRPQHIVVLGSSTAAGTGPSHPDSAWVNRYRKALEGYHPNYQVSNLARGGYQTFHLMPSSFVPPAGRPDPDTLRNITKALSLNPDAIIINLPSNDAAVGVSPAEQMANFRQMVDSATAQDVPVWVCTTQPRVFSPPQLLIQLAVRDSILDAFGDQAIDFWTGFADSLAMPLPIYDSGDGVHLNDAGHAILFQRVWEANIPEAAYLLVPYPSYDLLELDIDEECGHPATELDLRWANLGEADSLPTILRYTATGIDSPWQQILWDTLPPLGSCEDAHRLRALDLSAGGRIHLRAELWSGGDTLNLADTLTQETRLLETSLPLTTDETLCLGDSLTLMALPQHQESIRWYRNVSDSIAVASGSFLTIPDLMADTVLFVASLSPQTRWDDTLGTSDDFDRSWNGIMIDLQAEADLVLDSLYLPVSQLGNQTIRIYWKPGSHRQFEQSPSSWQLWDSVSLSVSSLNDWQAFPLDSFPLSAGDSVGLYLHLSNPSHRLRYLGVDAPRQFQRAGLRLFTGTGISYTFGQIFYPRQANIRFAFHRAVGPCEGGRVPVEARIANPFFSLGPDTTLHPGDTLSLSGPMADQYLWSTGDSTQQIKIYFASGSSDTLLVWLQATAGPGCLATDSLQVWVPEVLNGLFPVSLPPLQVYQAGRSHELLIVKGLQQVPDQVDLLDIAGRQVHSWPGQAAGEGYPLHNQVAGWYWVRIQGPEAPYPVLGLRLW